MMKQVLTPMTNEEYDYMKKNRLFEIYNED